MGQFPIGGVPFFHTKIMTFLGIHKTIESLQKKFDALSKFGDDKLRMGRHKFW